MEQTIAMKTKIIAQQNQTIIQLNQRIKEMTTNYNKLEKQNELQQDTIKTHLNIIDTMRTVIDDQIKEKNNPKEEQENKVTLIGDSNARRIADTNKEEIEYIEAKTAEDLSKIEERTIKNKKGSKYLLIGTNDIIKGEQAKETYEKVEEQTERLGIDNILAPPPINERNTKKEIHTNMEIYQIYLRKHNKYIGLNEPINMEDMQEEDPLHIKEEAAKRTGKFIIEDHKMIEDYSKTTKEQRRVTWADKVKTASEGATATTTTDTKTETKTIKINKAYTGLIVGKQGTRVKQIEEENQVKITIHKKEEDKTEQGIEITGHKQKIQETEQIITKIVQEAEDKAKEKESESRKRNIESPEREERDNKRNRLDTPERNRICKYWKNAGRCTNTNCSYKHTESEPCKYFQAGYCRYGYNCDNRHGKQ